MKVSVNENLQSIFNYINTSPDTIDYQELLDYCVIENKYKELYINFHIIKELITYHNESVLKRQVNYNI